MSQYYYSTAWIMEEGPFEAETDLLYCRLGPDNELVFEAGVISERQNRHHPEEKKGFEYEVETIGLRVAQYLDYQIEITRELIGSVHSEFIYKYYEIMRNYLFGPNPKPTLSPDMLMYLHFYWFKVIRAANEDNILSASGVDEPIPRVFSGWETQQYFRRRIQMRRDGNFPPLADEPWPPAGI